MRNRFIPISRRRERIHWKPATNFLQRRHCGSSTSCSALSFGNMREQPVPTSYQGYQGYEGGVFEGLSEAWDKLYNLIGCLFVLYFLTCIQNIKGVHAGDCTYLNNRKILCSGRNTRAPRTATTWLTEWMNRSGKFNGTCVCEIQFPVYNSITTSLVRL